MENSTAGSHQICSLTSSLYFAGRCYKLVLSCLNHSGIGSMGYEMEEVSLTEQSQTTQRPPMDTERENTQLRILANGKHKQGLLHAHSYILYSFPHCNNPMLMSLLMSFGQLLIQVCAIYEDAKRYSKC